VVGRKDKGTQECLNFSEDMDTSSSPHHKYIGAVNSVESSYERILDQVLKVIAQKLQESKE